MRAAIVGLGVIGRVRAEVLHAQGETLCAVCDTDAEKLKNFSAAGYTDYLRLLDERQLDTAESFLAWLSEQGCPLTKMKPRPG